MIQIMTDQDLSVQAVDSYKTTVRQKKKAAKTVLPPIEARLAAADYGNDASPPSSRSYRHFGAQRGEEKIRVRYPCLLYTSPSPRDLSTSRMPSSA